MRTFTLLVLASTVIVAYIVFVGGDLLPFIFMKTFGFKTLGEAEQGMPGLTRFVQNQSILFLLVGIALGITTIAAGIRLAKHSSSIAAIGISAQWILGWFVVFAFCYTGFQGPSGIHSSPSFDFGQFLSFGFGVFPVTLAFLLVSILLGVQDFRKASKADVSLATPGN